MNRLTANDISQSAAWSPETRPERDEPSGVTPAKVLFQAGDGQDVQGVVDRLSRHAVTFDLLQADVALRASEVLNGFKIISDGQTIYFGRAVISNLVGTASGIKCEVKLSPADTDAAGLKPAKPTTPNARDNYDRFFAGWQKEYRIAPEFKILVVDVAAYLTGVRQWLEQEEFRWREANERQREAAERDILERTAERIIKGFNVQHERFEELAAEIPPELLGAHQEFVRRHWHHLFLCSPFGQRTFHKPLGHAGDYEMMNMIYRNQPEGRSLYEKLIHLLLVSQWPAVSVRNRAEHMQSVLLSETARVARAGRRIRILDIGCGSAKELQDFMQQVPLSNNVDCTLLDFNQETLDHASSRLRIACQKSSSNARITTANTSVHQLLRRAIRQGDLGLSGPFDLIYSAGLFDYLADNTCRELVKLFYANVRPEGLVVVANMDDSKPFRRFIEFVLDWQLIYRKAPEVQRFAPETAGDTQRVIAEDAFGNLFLHLRKAD